MSSIRISLTEDDGLELMLFLEGALYAAPDDVIDGAAQRLLDKLQNRLLLRLLPADSPTAVCECKTHTKYHAKDCPLANMASG